MLLRLPQKLYITGLMKIKEIYRPVLRFLGNRVLYYVISVLCKSVKYHLHMPEETETLVSGDKRFIAGFWHGSMLAPWYINRNKNFSAIVSLSKDGEVLTRVLKKWNYQVVRGSSHKGGGEALNNMVKAAQDGYSVAITPDGPTGPAFVMKPGAVVTAKKSGLPLVLIGVGYKNYREFRSWDKFKLPKFFSDVHLFYSEPIYVEPDLEFEKTSDLIEKCDKMLNELQRKAEAEC